MQTRAARYLSTLVALACLAVALVGIPGTDAGPVPRSRPASALPALRSAPAPRARPVPPVGRSSSVVHGTADAGGARDGFGFSAADVNEAPDPTSPVSPAEGARVTTLTPTLVVATGTDWEGDPVSYRFKVTTKPDAETGTVVADAAVGSPSLSLPDGALKDGLTYFWHAYTTDASHPAGEDPGWVRSFRVDLRLGSRGTFPMESVGPVSVNLGSGNLVAGASSATVGSLGGPVGVSLAYNSRAPVVQPGLIGSYTVDRNGNHSVDSPDEAPSIVRRDPQLAFDWTSAPPIPGITATSMVVRWVGNVTVPGTSTLNYLFGATTSDGVRIRVNNSLVLDSWSSQSAGAPVYGSSISLTGGSTAAIQVDWYKSTTLSGATLKLYVKGGSGNGLAENLVPASWLSSESPSLPRGWTLGPLGGSGLAYVRAEVSDDRVVLVGPDGDTHVYVATTTGYTPPKDEDGVLARDANGLLTLGSTDGVTYTFDAAGNLTSASDAGNLPAEHQFTWSTPSGLTLSRLTGIVDPVSARRTTLRYGGDGACPSSPPSGFDASAPIGMLCAIELWDGRTTKLWYVSGRLGRVENPGAEVTDFAYDSDGRLAQVRDPLAADLVAAGTRADDATTRTVISYDAQGRVSGVELAAPTSGADRPGRTFAYTSTSETRVHVTGLTEPSGWARKVTFDDAGRQLTDTDATDKATTVAWNDADQIVSSVDGAGLKTTNVYDRVGRLTDAYGPAPSSWFGTDDLPTSDKVGVTPRSRSAYDEGWHGLDVTYFDNPNFGGAVVGHAFQVGDTSGAVSGAWTVAPPGVTATRWSARMTGEIRFDVAGTYTFAPVVMGTAKVYVDDTKVVDTTTAASGTYVNHVADTWHRLRVDYVAPDPSASVAHQLFVTATVSSWTVPSGVGSVTVEAWGGQGGAGAALPHSGGSRPGGSGGAGGYVRSTLAVAGGDGFTVDVGGVGGAGATTSGGAPGHNDGGAGGAGGGGGGGGRTVVSKGANVVTVAAGGGGGGAAWSSLFDGKSGGASGAAGVSGPTGTGGLAGAAGSGGSPNGGTLGGGVGGDGYSYFGTPIPGSGGGGAGHGGGGGGTGASGGGGGGNWTSGSSPTITAAGNTNGNGRVDISWASPPAIDLQWAVPDTSTFVVVPGSRLQPRYGLVTSTVDPDGRKVATEYARPELGLATATVVDPDGLALRSTTTYEMAGYLRRTARTLPKGSATTVTYTYYGATETRANPCVSGSAAVNQGGMLKLSTDADPDGAGSQSGIRREQVYDTAGRVVASRVVGDSAWSCTAYDTRGRVTSSVDRAGGTTTWSYATAGTITVTSPDSAGTSRSTVTTVDLLGRTLTYTDELGSVTRSAFTRPGQVATTYRAFSGGSEAVVTSATYDAAGRTLTASDWLTGSARTTAYTYDAAGRVATETRPNGVVTSHTYSTTSGREVQTASYPSSTGAPTTTATFAYTGAPDAFTVPSYAREVTIEAYGAQGGSPGGGGAKGGHARATVAVTGGQVLQVRVGGQGAPGDTTTNAGGAGGYNGGGAGGSVASAYPGSGGGGASDVRVGGYGLGDRVVVAGGGGGGSSAGIGGGASGTAGAADGYGQAGGGGGTASVGGAGAPNGNGPSGAPGGFGVGGDGTGSGASHTASINAGSGGGGGWYGGGGGAEGASYGPNGPYGSVNGGGGSSHASGVDIDLGAVGSLAGDGRVVITYPTSALPTSTRTYSLGGRVVTDGQLATDRRSYTYDGAGRLTTTTQGSTTRRYAYDADTNRCGLAASCESAWAYDDADRITASPYATAYTYDSHGNLTATTGTSGNPSSTIAYDAWDHATVVNDGTTTVTETLTPSGRVLRRVVTTNASGAVTEDTSYGYSGPGDSPAYSRPTSGGAVTTYLMGMSGLTDVGGTGAWSIHDAHGDVQGTTSATGAFTAVPTADELGVGTTPASRLGWLGRQQRPSIGGNLGLVRMGVRLYDPRLGRFLEVDPVEGGSANDYDYCAGDPVNCFDLGGTMKTPENKQASSADVLKALAYLAEHPEVVLYLKGLAAAKPASTQQPPPGQNPRRGPDPSAPGGDGGRRGPDPCHCPPPTGPRAGALDTKTCAAGIGVLLLSAVGWAASGNTVVSNAASGGAGAAGVAQLSGPCT